MTLAASDRDHVLEQLGLEEPLGQIAIEARARARTRSRRALAAKIVEAAKALY